MSRLPTAESFLKDVADHVLEVARDDGFYRHLKFRRPDSIAYWFDVVTWPGSLCVKGDMGCYVFSRVPDMLAFFRRESGDPVVNLGYWAEKVQAADRHSGIKEYSPDLFREAVRRALEAACGDEPPPRGLMDAVESDVLSHADDGEHEAVRAAMGFEHQGFHLEDFYEYNVRDYTCQFVWCCHAVSWAVQQYDAAKAPGASP